MVLWEMLSKQRDFLAEKTRRLAMFFILARCKISTMRYQAEMYDSLDALGKYGGRHQPVPPERSGNH